MSEIKALDKLREWARIATTADDPIWGIIGDIELEIEWRYMELPKDADGVPIHVGDELGSADGEFDTEMTVNYIAFDGDEYAIEEYFTEPPTFFPGFRGMKHVKPRTLEDMLTDFVIAVREDANLTNGVARNVDKYAAEIRELMAGDE